MTVRCKDTKNCFKDFIFAEFMLMHALFCITSK